MKFCENHWDMLRKAIDEAGLGKFVTVGEGELAKRLKDDGFEPLLFAHNLIVSNTLNLVGLDLLNNNPDGSDRCPLCFLTQDHLENCQLPDCPTKNFDHWIGKSVEDAMIEAVKRGLVAST